MDKSAPVIARSLPRDLFKDAVEGSYGLKSAFVGNVRDVQILREQCLRVRNAVMVDKVGKVHGDIFMKVARKVIHIDVQGICRRAQGDIFGVMDGNIAENIVQIISPRTFDFGKYVVFLILVTQDGQTGGKLVSGGVLRKDHILEYKCAHRFVAAKADVFPLFVLHFRRKIAHIIFRKDTHPNAGRYGGTVGVDLIG